MGGDGDAVVSRTAEVCHGYRDSDHLRACADSCRRVLGTSLPFARHRPNMAGVDLLRSTCVLCDWVVLHPLCGRIFFREMAFC